MRRPALYSRTSRNSRTGSEGEDLPVAGDAVQGTVRARMTRLAKQLSPHNIYLLWSVLGLLALLLAISLALPMRSAAHKLTQDDINAAVLKTLETTNLPSAAA